MENDAPQYDPRYLAGIVLFNRGDYFEAHEVWELMWMDISGPEKQFYQGLIQVAVGLCHFCNGNLAGAVKLYHSSRGYLARYGDSLHGLDLKALFAQMERCFGPLLGAEPPPPRLPPVEEDLPEIHLDPPPEAWPDPSVYLEEDH